MRTTVMIMHNDGRIEDVPITGIIRELVGLVETLDERVKVLEKQDNGISARFSGVCLAPPTEGMCAECPAFHRSNHPHTGDPYKQGQCRLNGPINTNGRTEGGWPWLYADSWCYAGRELIARMREREE